MYKRQEQAEYWFEEMRNANLAPNDFTFAVLMNKSANEKQAEHWYEKMREANIVPDVATFSTLIDKSESEERAEYWYKDCLLYTSRCV